MKINLLKILFLILIINPFPTVYAQENPLTLWIMPNESPIVHKPTNEEIERFLHNNPNIENTDSELKSDREFARAVLGQTKILEIIKRYRKERRFTGQINIKILKWRDVFGFEEILDAARVSRKKFPPAIVQLGSTWNAYFASKGALVEITRDIDEKLYFESSIKSCKIEGSKKIYALPLNVDIRVLYYWKNIIANPEVELGDWEALKRTSHRIQGLINDKNAPKGMLWSIGFPIASGEWDILHQFAIWVWGAGGEIVRSKKILGLFPVKQGNLDSKEVGDAVTFLMELTDGGDSPQPQLTLGELEERFIKGEFGMIITGSWLMKRLKDKFGTVWKDRVGVVLPPAGPVKRATFIGGCNLAIFKVTKQRDNFTQAVDFLKFLCNDAQFEYGVATGALPGLKKAMDEYIASDSSYQIFKQALKRGKSYPSIPEWAELVEKEVTLNNLYRLWNAIKNRASEDEIREYLKVGNNLLNRKLFWEKILILAISCVGGICLFGFIWRSFREKRRFNLKIQTKEKEIVGHKLALQSFMDQIQKLTQEKERLTRAFKDKEIEENKYKSRINEITSDLQKYSSELAEKERKISGFENQVNRLKGDKYSVRIFYKTKEALEGNRLLEYLLHLENIIKIEIEDRHNDCVINVSSSLDQKKYEYEKKLFIFLAYFTYRYKDNKEMYTSPVTITDAPKKIRFRIREEAIFYTIGCAKRDWGVDRIEYYSAESIKKWIFPTLEKEYLIRIKIYFLKIRRVIELMAL